MHVTVCMLQRTDAVHTLRSKNLMTWGSCSSTKRVVYEKADRYDRESHHAASCSWTGGGIAWVQSNRSVPVASFGTTCRIQPECCCPERALEHLSWLPAPLPTAHCSLHQLTGECYAAAVATVPEEATQACDHCNYWQSAGHFETATACECVAQRMISTSLAIAGLIAT